MISYSKLGAKVWTLVEQRRASFLDNEKPWVQEIERLDAEIIAWYARVPPEVQIRDWHEEGHINSTSSYNLQRLRVWTYLRKNQVSIGLMIPAAFANRDLDTKLAACANLAHHQLDHGRTASCSSMR